MTDTGNFPGPPQPGAEHARLQPFVGTFRAVVKLFMGPGMTHETTGTMTNTFQLDGLYLHQDYVGDPSEGPFPSFLGKGYWGFNANSGQYEGFWIDNASTIMQTEQGDVDSAGRVWTMLGTFTPPGSSQAMTRKSVITLQDDDHHRMDSFMTGPDGQEMKTMEIAYTRAK